MHCSRHKRNGSNDKRTNSEPIPGGNSADDNSAFELRKDLLQTLKHDIQKRQAPPDFLAGWQIPLFYKACTLISGLASAPSKPLYAKLFGPFALTTAPIIPIAVMKKLKIGVTATAPLVPYAIMKKLSIGVCPPLSVLSWFFASGVNPVPGV